MGISLDRHASITEYGNLYNRKVIIILARIIVIANHKGGVGKTTTASSMASGLKCRGYKVLVIDTDPKGNLSESIEADTKNLPTIYEVLKEEVSARNAIQKFEAFDIIPANVHLAGAETEFVQIGKEYLLKETLSSIEKYYAYIIIDTPPALGIMTVNAFTFSHEIIIPTTAEMFSANCIVQLYDTVQTVIKYCNPNLIIRGILITMYNPRAPLHQDVKERIEKIANTIETPIFNTNISSSILVSEAQASQLDIFTYYKKSIVTEDYKAFVEEYLKELENKESRPNGDSSIIDLV